MTTSPTSQPVRARRTLEAWLAPSIAGLALLGVTALMGFEEPNAWLLLIATGLALAAPVTVLVHLALTRQLSRDEKRMWRRELTGVSAASALAEYLRASDHRTVIAQRVRQRAARRHRS
jgi:uncharacterized membrane protein